MKKLAVILSSVALLGLAACEGETTAVEEPVVTDADDTGVDPVDTDVEAAPVTGGAAEAAPGTDEEVLEEEVGVE